MIVLPYRPRPGQKQVHRLIDASRFVVCVNHRRWGKTVCAVNQGIKEAHTCAHSMPQVAYVAPFRNQAKRVAWKYLQQFSQGTGATFNNSELIARYPASNGEFHLLGADRPDTIRGAYYDFVIFDEYAQMSPRFFPEVMRPLLADRKGRAVFIGTPQGRNAFWELYERAGELPDWSRIVVRASESGVIDSAELQAAKREMTPEQYAQEFECSWSAAIRGAFYGQELADAEREGRITSVLYDKMLPVISSWDIGINDTAVWLWQVAGNQVRALECRQYSRSSLVDIVRDLEKLPHAPAEFILPHDCRVKEYGSGKTRVEVLNNLGISPEVCRNIPELDGIDAGRMLMPRIWWDEKGCKDGLEALRQFRAEYDEKKRAYRVSPLSDWTHHPADAFRYFAVHNGGQQSFTSWNKPIDYRKRAV